MTTTETASRVVYCECGIGLHGDSDEAVLTAAELHIALDHGRLLHGAGPDAGRRPIGRMYQTARSFLCRT